MDPGLTPPGDQATEAQSLAAKGGRRRGLAMAGLVWSCGASGLELACTCSASRLAPRPRARLAGHRTRKAQTRRAWIGRRMPAHQCLSLAGPSPARPPARHSLASNMADAPTAPAGCRPADACTYADAHTRRADDAVFAAPYVNTQAAAAGAHIGCTAGTQGERQYVRSAQSCSQSAPAAAHTEKCAVRRAPARQLRQQDHRIHARRTSSARVRECAACAPDSEKFRACPSYRC